MTTLFNLISLNDDHGLAKFITLNDCNIYAIYNKNKTTYKNIINTFFENYSCKEVERNKIELYLLDTKKLIDENLYSETLSTIVTPNKIITFKLRVKHNNHHKKIDNIDTDNQNKGNEISIYVKALDERVYHININENNTIFQLKEKISKLTRIPSDQMRLIFSCNRLSDNEIIKNYNITNGNTVNMVLRLRGGMYHETSGKNGNYEQLKELLFLVDVNPSEVIKS